MSDSIDHQINKHFSRLILLIVVTFFLSIITYGSPFLFWQAAFSDLGSTVTPEGTPNKTACCIFMTGLIICGIVLLKIGHSFKSADTIAHNQVKAYLCLMGAIGSFIFIFPHNINDNVHMIGAAMFVAAIWALSTLLLIEQYNSDDKLRIIPLQFLLQATVLSYAFTYFREMPGKNIAQKFAVLGLLVVLKAATSTQKEKVSC